MNLKAYYLPLAILLFLGSTPRSIAAYGDRSRPDASLLGQAFAAASVPELNAIEPSSRKPASLRQRFAHAIIVRTSPEKGGVAPKNIEKVEVWYDARIRNEFVALAVINSAGERVDKHDAAIDTFDRSHVSTSVEALPPGEYTVRYRAISADGHQVSGTWVFQVTGQ
jgi:methionine-rich copper-binding protein CopC